MTKIIDTAKTSQGANQTAESIGNSSTGADLRRSVADFKIPG